MKTILFSTQLLIFCSSNPNDVFFMYYFDYLLYALKLGLVSDIKLLFRYIINLHAHRTQSIEQNVETNKKYPFISTLLF